MLVPHDGILAFLSPPFEYLLMLIQCASPDFHVCTYFLHILYSRKQNILRDICFYFEFLPDKHISTMINLVCISNSKICFKKSIVEINHRMQFKIIIIMALACVLCIQIFYKFTYYKDIQVYRPC